MSVHLKDPNSARADATVCGLFIHDTEDKMGMTPPNVNCVKCQGTATFRNAMRRWRLDNPVEEVEEVPETKATVNLEKLDYDLMRAYLDVHPQANTEGLVMIIQKGRELNMVPWVSDNGDVYYKERGRE